MSDSLGSTGLQLAKLLWPWHSPGNNTGVGYRPLLQRVFPTQGSNPGLEHCRCILYHLSHQGIYYIHAFMLSCFSHPTLWDPIDCRLPGSSAHGILQARKLEWVVLPSSRGSSWLRDWTHVSCLLPWHMGSLPLAPPGEPIIYVCVCVCVCVCIFFLFPPYEENVPFLSFRALLAPTATLSLWCSTLQPYWNWFSPTSVHFY